jgi:glutathione S-transferase
MAQAGGPEVTAERAQTSGKYTLKSAGKGQYKVAPGENINFATAGAQAFLRFGSGAFVSGKLDKFTNRPKQPIELYEFEGCPFCRKVREVCSILDIDVLFYPCPQGGPNWRPKAQQESGKSQFPYMKDPNTGRSMLESDAIIKYLVTEYGDGVVPLTLNLGPLTTITAGLAMLPRAGRGSRYRPSKLPKEPIDLWGYEASPFVKQVREVLCELELPHVYHTVARNSPRRKELENKWQTFQVPYIEDPNTGIAMFETKEIISYLNDSYAV